MKGFVFYNIPESLSFPNCNKMFYFLLIFGGKFFKMSILTHNLRLMYFHFDLKTDLEVAIIFEWIDAIGFKMLVWILTNFDFFNWNFFLDLNRYPLVILFSLVFLTPIDISKSAYWLSLPGSIGKCAHWQVKI